MAFVVPFLPSARLPVSGAPRAAPRVPRRARAPAPARPLQPCMQMGTPPDSSPLYGAGDGGNDGDANQPSHTEVDVTPGDTSGPGATDDAATIDARVRDVPLQDLKCELYSKVASLNRGLAASPDARADVLQLVSELEALNPTTGPADRPDLLVGDWRLVFTNALDVLSLGLLAPLALVSEVYQNVAAAPSDKEYEYDVQNVVELEPPFAPVSNAFVGRTVTTITVAATGARTSADRVDITFVDSSVKQTEVFGMAIPQALPPLRVPLGRPVGYIDTTFLDEDLRVVRAPPIRGIANVFVLRREVTRDTIPMPGEDYSS